MERGDMRGERMDEVKGGLGDTRLEQVIKRSACAASAIAGHLSSPTGLTIWAAVLAACPAAPLTPLNMSAYSSRYSFMAAGLLCAVVLDAVGLSFAWSSAPQLPCLPCCRGRPCCNRTHPSYPRCVSVRGRPRSLYGVFDVYQSDVFRGSLVMGAARNKGVQRDGAGPIWQSGAIYAAWQGRFHAPSRRARFAR